MFTGLVTDVGRVTSVGGDGPVRRIRISTSYRADTIALGASVACSGPCLTVVGRGPDGERAWFEVDAAAETLARTTVGSWAEGARINLERSLKVGDELGGHIVTGHVDGVATVVERETVSDPAWGESARFVLRASPGLMRFVAEKGSITLDGTSLTVNAVTADTLSVLIIPHTLAVTTWGERRVGDRMNLEVDLMARYAARLAETGSTSRVEGGAAAS